MVGGGGQISLKYLDDEIRGDHVKLPNTRWLLYVLHANQVKWLWDDGRYLTGVQRGKEDCLSLTSERWPIAGEGPATTGRRL